MAKCLFYSRNLIFRKITVPINTLFKRQFALTEEDVKRASITPKSDNPFDLFKDWSNEANQKLTKPMALTFILSNYSPERKVRSRLMLNVNQEGDTFTIFGSNKTHKMQDIKTNPYVSMCFVWTYPKDNYYVLRQVLVTGQAAEIPKEKMIQIFEKLNLPLRIEWSFCKQNEVVGSWKAKQEEFMKLNKELKTVPMPSYMTGFKVTVNEIIFFHNILKTKIFYIPDRVFFKKDGSKWKYEHISA